MMQFNPDRSKQTIQTIFSQRKDAVVYPPVFFNGSEVAVKAEHKHFTMTLDSKLNFQSHIREAIIKASRGIGMIHYLSKYVSWDIDLDITISALALCAFVKLELRAMNTSSCTAHATVISAENSLAVS